MADHLEQEHWNLDPEGNLKGVWALNTDNATGGRWAMIDQVIREYTQLHPSEMEMLVYENKAISDSRNAHAASENKSIRWGISVPAGLLFALERVEPMLFVEKPLYHEFLKRYKGLRICKVV